ncbi:hypothetical protein ALC62_01483 [Cyphomyrmex costatus]|uniref:Uncharacterized protein n=1 Tax=Cyphomyrmex costatus TaxID=456900 RepID=A0A195D340_9HYME|nr:hypothetical protein ALC62_01483 [Cyphomyrmex costatus]
MTIRLHETPQNITRVTEVHSQIVPSIQSGLGRSSGSCSAARNISTVRPSLRSMNTSVNSSELKSPNAAGMPSSTFPNTADVISLHLAIEMSAMRWTNVFLFYLLAVLLSHMFYNPNNKNIFNVVTLHYKNLWLFLSPLTKQNLSLLPLLCRSSNTIQNGSSCNKK